MGKLKQTKKTLQMKFSLIALVGATAAIKIRSSKSDGPSSGGPPSCEDIGEHILKQCDSSENRKISWKEAVVCGAPKDFKGEFLKVAGKDAEVDMSEFVKVCEAHMKDASSLAQEGPPSCNQIGEHILKQCDSSENRKISWKEAVVCGAPKDFKGEFLKVA